MITHLSLGIMGRLGNQLYQYALLKAVAARCGYEPRIPKRFKGNTDRPLPNGENALAAFRLECEEVPDPLPPLRRYENLDRVYDPGVFEAGDDVDYVGYFQSYRYFEPIANDVRREFRFRPDIEDRADESLGPLRREGRPLVSLHVRRGDFLTGGFHVPEPEYYRRAMTRFPDALFVITSDEIEWCRAHFLGEPFRFNANGDYWVDMAAMTRMDHSIASTSTFSWWASWLNESPGALVIAPEPTVPDNGYYPPADRYPPHWELIDSEAVPDADWGVVRAG